MSNTAVVEIRLVKYDRILITAMMVIVVIIDDLILIILLDQFVM